MIRTFKHTLQSWEVYPRIYYYNNRLVDFLPRFKSIIGPYSKILKDAKHLIKELKELKSNFEQPPEIIIIGDEDVPEDDLVVANLDEQQRDPFFTSNVKTEESGSGFTIVICHAKITDLDKTPVQVLKPRFELLKGLNNRRKEILFVVCSMTNIFKTKECEAFKAELEQFVNVSCDKYSDKHCLVMTDDEDPSFKERISNALELIIIGGFNNARTLLANFKRTSTLSVQDSVPLLDNPIVMEKLTSLYEMKVDVLGTFAEKLALALRCALIEPLSEKHCLRSRVCNTKLVVNDFEDSVTKKVLDRTEIKPKTIPLRYLKEIAVPLKEFKDNVQDIVAQVEKDFEIFARVLHKLSFEINGYLKKSTVLKVPEATKRQYFDKSTAEEILKLTNVCGAGTVYGEFEIHIDNKDRMGEVKQEVAAIFSKKKISSSFKVKVIERKATELADNSIVHGDLIFTQDQETNKPRKGTLGGFVKQERDEKLLYGLTCGHVAGNRSIIYLDGNDPFARCLSSIREGFIDIALLQINRDLYNRCITLFKDERGQWRQAQLFQFSSPIDIAGENVFKYGAITKLTTGIVCSEDFRSYFGTHSNCVLLIDGKMGNNMPPFAEPGDSGSMICMPNIDNTNTLYAVALLSHGQLKLEGLGETPYFVCSVLKLGLEKLRQLTGNQFRFSDE